VNKEDIYYGDFIIGIYCAIHDYSNVYGKEPKTVAVDSKHFNKLKEIEYGSWIDRNSMKTMDDIQVVEETRWQGEFTSCRSENYKSR